MAEALLLGALMATQDKITSQYVKTGGGGALGSELKMYKGFIKHPLYTHDPTGAGTCPVPWGTVIPRCQLCVAISYEQQVPLCLFLRYL